jgi:(p)ppGpp synthase/HD superfamily hydrolase
MKNKIQENRKTFIERLQKFNPSQNDINLIMQAYDLAKEAHRTHMRDEGVRYFEHPRACAIIMLCELGYYDRDAIIAILFHDLGEDSSIFGNVKANYEVFKETLLFRVSNMFNTEIANLVLALTRPQVDEIVFKTKQETYDFYIAELVKNPKALLLKMVDRLHNLRTSGVLETERRLRIANETISLYLPIFEELTKHTVYGEYALKLLADIKSIVVPAVQNSLDKKVLCQAWEESEYEEGWGVTVRDHSYTLHTNTDNLKAFIKEYWGTMPDKTLSYYIRPYSNPYWCIVDQKTYDEIVLGKHGKRFYEDVLPKVIER